jgi:hypothetical protein
VAAGIPCINIYVPHQDRIKQEEQDFTGYYEGLLSGRPQSLMNFQGCIQRVDRRRVAKTLAHTTMAEFQIDPQARRAYAHRFLGIEEKPSSIRILERLEEMVQAEPSVA